MSRTWEEMLSDPIEGEEYKPDLENYYNLRQKENETVICGDCLYPISICRGCKS